MSTTKPVLPESELATLMTLAGDLSTLVEKELTHSMQLFLLARPEAKSDAEAARLVDLAVETPGKWKRTVPAFKAIYEEIMLVQKQKIIAAAEFDKDEFIDKNLIPDALKRYAEILAIPITRHTEAALVAQIRQAANTVLGSRDILSGADSDPNKATVIIQNFIDEGKKYKPAWKRDTPSPLEVEVPA